MPVIKVPSLPESVDPAQASVFDPLYKTLMRKATSLAGLDDPQSMVMQSLAPSPLIARVPPNEIAALRGAGKALLDRVLKDGLEERSIGGRPMTSDGLTKWMSLDNAARHPIPEEFYVPRKPVPPDLANALIHAQRKYPRIFGHIRDIADVDSMTKLNSFPGEVLGSQSFEHKFVPPDGLAPTGFSNMGFNPETIAKFDKGAASTVGHELLHHADNIVNPKRAVEGYEASMRLPSGDWGSAYKGSAFEARANVQGERFANAVKGVPNPKPTSIGKLEDMVLSSEQPPPVDSKNMDIIDWLKSKFSGR